MANPNMASIIIPTYKREDLLRNLLASLSRQRTDYPFEVIVVNDAPGEDLSPLELEFSDISLKVINLAEDHGRGVARNTAVRNSTGEILIFLDDDMRADPRLVASHVRFHDAHPNAGAIGNALTAPELGDSLLFRYMDTRGVHKLARWNRSPARYFVTNNASVPRSALLEAGLFDEAFRSYGFEDTELAFRLEDRVGLSFWYLEDAIAHHIHHHSVDQLLEKRLIAARSSLPLLLERHPGRARDLSITELLPPSPDDTGWVLLRKSILTFLMAGPLERAARRLVEIHWLGPVAYPLFDYLIAATYRRGLREGRGVPSGRP